MHIEFLGPPGGGKSTLFNKLSDLSHFNPGIEASNRYSIYRYMDIIYEEYIFESGLIPPNISQKYVHQFVAYELAGKHHRQFIEINPNYSGFPEELFDSQKEFEKLIHRMWKYAAQRYQLGSEYLAEEEYLCIDEGFAQAAAGTLWRADIDDFNTDIYFGTVPFPQYIVHVDPPVDVCLKRQKETSKFRSGSKGNSPSEQENHKRMCSYLADEYSKRDVNVIQINNTDSLELCVSKITSTIEMPEEH